MLVYFVDHDDPMGSPLETWEHAEAVPRTGEAVILKLAGDDKHQTYRVTDVGWTSMANGFGVARVAIKPNRS